LPFELTLIGTTLPARCASVILQVMTHQPPRGTDCVDEILGMNFEVSQ